MAMSEGEVVDKLAALAIEEKKETPFKGLGFLVPDSKTKTIKVLFFSQGTAGKTSIIKRFTGGSFIEKPERTIHESVVVTREHKGQPVQYMIEEVSGTVPLGDILPRELFNSNIAVLCCRPSANQPEKDMWALIQEHRESIRGTTVVFAKTFKDVDRTFKAVGL